MKKLLLLAAGAFMALSASAQWAVVGGYTEPSWNFEESTKFTGEGDNLSCEIANLSSGFKIVDITNNNWDTQYGTSTKMVINTPVKLDGKVGGQDPANIEFPFGVLSIKNVTVKWNPSTFTLELVADQSDVVTGYPDLYFTGSFNDWATPGDAKTVLGDLKDGIYTFEVDLGAFEKIEFKLAMENWGGTEIAGGAQVGYEPVDVTAGGSNLTTTLNGEQVLIFDSAKMQMWFVDPSGAVEGIEVDNAPAVYYNLSGVRVNNPEKGIYIVKQGDKTRKVVVR